MNTPRTFMAAAVSFDRLLQESETLETELDAMMISRDEARRFAESYKALLWESETQLIAMTKERDSEREKVRECTWKEAKS